ncbi:esterase-like activity of phytase family protein [Rhizobium sp. SL42]|uniref:esterase-like activity of phytase family protein n=1 Tax=Rhizobium sp. SL42 TaxID=2806346 RepID=UPI001F34FA61|nr:esterase-like activity of phytase family protein [Rhizobium sp. SL42]UJW75156.1 esterase-like activity of phytase family protein [Rhizobium sp. SL42]
MPRPVPGRLSGASLLTLASVLLLASCTPSELKPGEALPIGIQSRAIASLGGAPRSVEGVSFVGGLEISSEEPLFGAFSSIRIVDDSRFVGVFDTGYWIEGRIERGPDGLLSGVTDVTLSAMLDRDGHESVSKYQVDAESLALVDGAALVGFEQRHRVVAYQPLASLATARPSTPLALPFPVSRLRGNGGIEALVVAPADGPLEGAVVAITEKSVDEDGNNFAGILGGPLAGEFRVRPHDGFEITDGVFLPSGDLVLLERRFSIASGVAMRLRRIDGALIRSGAIVDGPVIFEADHASEIDNMEGIDAVVAKDGSIHLIAVSDDNHSILQRTVMLEFRLEP